MNRFLPISGFLNSIIKSVDIRYLSLLFFIEAVVMYKIVFLKNVISETDLLLQMYPWRALASEMILKGQLPLWNPYIGSGTPLLADVQSAVLYPLNILLSFLPPEQILRYSFIAHLYLSGLFTYYFSKSINVNRFGSFISAVVFMLGLFTFANKNLMGNHVIWNSVMYLPLLFLVAENAFRKGAFKYSLLLGLIVGLQNLGGHPQISFYSFLSLSLYFIFRMSVIYLKDRSAKRIRSIFVIYFFMIISGACLSAVQYLPTLELVSLSDRCGMLKEFSGLSISEFVRPSIIYMGIFPLLLTFISILFRRDAYSYSYFFGFLSIISLLLIFKFTRLGYILTLLIPGFGFFMGFDRAQFVYIFSIAVLSGIGACFLTELKKKKTFNLLNTILVIFILLCGLATILLLINEQDIMSLLTGLSKKNIYITLLHNFKDSKDLTAFKINQLYSSLLFLLKILLIICGSFFILLFHYSNGKIPSGVFRVSLVALTVFSFTICNDLSFIDLKSYFKDTPLIGFLKNRAKMDRIVSIFPKHDKNISNINFLRPNTSSVFKVNEVQVYTPLYLNRYKDFLKLINEERSDMQPNEYEERVLSLDNYKSKLLDLLNARYIITSTNITDEQFIKIFDDGLKVYENKLVIPRTFFVSNYKVIEKKEDILSELKNKSFDPEKYAIIERAPEKPFFSSNHPEISENRVSIIDYMPQKVIIEANVIEEGFLILGDTYYPGWKVFVNNNESIIYRTDYILRGVYLNPGRHIVEFVYDPFSYKIGMAITLIALAGIIGFFIYCTYSEKIGRGNEQ